MGNCGGEEVGWPPNHGNSLITRYLIYAEEAGTKVARTEFPRHARAYRDTVML